MTLSSNTTTINASPCAASSELLAPLLLWQQHTNTPLSAINCANRTIWVQQEQLRFAAPWHTLGGNKFWKLWGFLEQAVYLQKQHPNFTVVSFGGSQSNHLHALAAACHLLDLKCVGIIRAANTPAALAASQHSSNLRNLGMQLKTLSATEYRLRHDSHYQQLLAHPFAPNMVIPEGGNSPLANVGLRRLADELTQQFAQQFGKRTAVSLALAVGTGTTFVGLARYLPVHIHIIGVAMYKDTQLLPRLQQQLQPLRPDSSYQLIGWRKPNTSLSPHAQTITNACHHQNITLDPMYTLPLLTRLLELFDSGSLIDNRPVIMLHTGGLR